MKRLLLIVLVLLLGGLTACDAIDTNLLPASDNTYDVGSEDLPWAEGWFADLYVNGVPVGTGSGDVVGPGSATDTAIALFNGVTGKLIQDSVVTIDGAGNVTTAGTIDGRDVSVDGTTLDALGLSAYTTRWPTWVEVTDKPAIGDVFSTDNILDHSVVRGDGGVKNIQDSEVDGHSVTIGDFGNLVATGDLDGFDINAANDLNCVNDLDVTDDAGIGGILGVGETFSVTGTSTFNDQISLAGSGKAWIELRPELDFDIIKKNTVPLSYQRGVFSSFELPIYAADNQELYFDICVPDRWDGTSTVHVHLDVFLIDAQDDGDDFRLQIDYEHYNPGTDTVPNTSTPIAVETETGASVAFQSYHVHFDVPAGDMLGDDILAFRLRRIATTGTEIDGLVVLQHAGIIFLCDKLGNTTAE